MSADIRIAALHGRQIFDSRGRPTVEVEIRLVGGATGRASAPSGASTGRHEARELRDGDPEVHAGRGVLRAVDNINTLIARSLIGHDAASQATVDALMCEVDGTAGLDRLGGNAVLATSLAVCRAAATAHALPLYRYIETLSGSERPSLPMPMVNILSGGAHAGRRMDLQDFLVIPVGAEGYADALRMALLVRNAADKVFAGRNWPTLLADEGGLSPDCRRIRDALDLMIETIETAGLRPGSDVAIAIDVAASEFFAAGKYQLRREARQMSSTQMTSMIMGLLDDYPIISIEDPLHQDDWETWSTLTAAARGAQIIGDDLFATNVSRIARGIDLRAANAVLIKPNQNGTLTGTLAALAAARDGGFATIVSARSGETEDDFIADLAVGTGAGQIKVGSVRTAERMAKYNRLVRISEDASLSFSAALPRPAG